MARTIQTMDSAINMKTSASGRTKDPGSIVLFIAATVNNEQTKSPAVLISENDVGDL